MIEHEALLAQVLVGVLGVGGPVPLKVLEKRGPVGRQAMYLEVAQRKGKPVIDANDRRNVLREPLGQPVRNAASRPVLARAGRRRHLGRRGLADGALDAQALETGLGRLGAGIVYADVAGKRGHRDLRPTQDTSASRLS